MDSNNQNIGDMHDAKNDNEENSNPNAKTSCENLTFHNADKDNPPFKEDHDLNSESEAEVLTEDYVIVSYVAQYYPGQVIEIDPEYPDPVTIKHMEKNGKLEGWK
ncbi:hypothetical protein JTB14_006375 [Gonioctena quinquepunctata]|nr:hypothetical protein JTB14_006375 [Gonioctena quinquepunctata]